MNIKYFMKKALDQANKALLADEIPVGAVLVDNNNNKIISESYNLINANHNATQHAEMIVIHKACQKRQSKFLSNTSLFVTLEFLLH